MKSIIRKYLILLSTTTFILHAFMGCEKKYVAVTPEEETGSVNEDDDDYTGDGSDTIFITLNGTSAQSSNTSKATVSGTIVTIISGGTYTISGSVSDGQIIVNSSDDEDVRLVLDGANITSLSSAPVYVKASEKTIVVLTDGTVNYVKDGTSYTYDDTENQEPNAAIFSKSDITFYGTGALIVDANFNDGISGRDGLIIKSGNITITAADDGIRGKDYLIVHDGTINVTSAGDGMKSDNESGSEAGYISIDAGKFNINSAGDALNAVTNITVLYADMEIKSGGGSGTGVTTEGYSGSVSAKAFKATAGIEINDGSIVINSADDAFNSEGDITINGGTITVSTSDDAVHAEGILAFNGGNMNVTKCYEGFEGPSLNLSGGYVRVVSTDDSFNATMGMAVEGNDGSVLNITGGTIVLNTSKGDGLDSNGNITMSNGTVIVHGPSQQPEVAFDVNGTFNISGGLLIGSGPNSGNMIEATSTSSAQYTVKITSQALFSNSSLFHIQDEDAKDIVTFKPMRNAYYIVFSSSELTANGTYSIYTGGAYDLAGSDGLYTGGTYSGGTFKKSFIVSGKVTNVSF